MNGNSNSPSQGDKTGEQDENRTTATAFDGGDCEKVAGQLRQLAQSLRSELLQLAADVEAGEEIHGDRVVDVREDIHTADMTVRRHLGAEDFLNLPAEVDGDSIDQTFAEVDGDLTYLRENAPREEVSRRLADAVLDARVSADRVDAALYAGDLTDVHVEDLWNKAGTVEAWARDVLVQRADRDLEERPETDESPEENHA